MRNLRLANDKAEDLTIKKIANAIQIRGKITGTMEQVCDRCLKNFEYKIDLDIDEKISLIPLYDYSNKEIKLTDDKIEDELLDSDKRYIK